MTDELDWFAALPGLVRAALWADPGAALAPSLIARLPRLYRSACGADDPATGYWVLRPRDAEHLD
jgi:hypothetical protein